MYFLHKWFFIRIQNLIHYNLCFSCTTRLDELPDDVLKNIVYNYLSIKDVVNMRLVSKAFRDIIPAVNIPRHATFNYSFTNSLNYSQQCVMSNALLCEQQRGEFTFTQEKTTKCSCMQPSTSIHISQ